MNECCNKFPAPTNRFTELSSSLERHGSLYQCSICGNLYEIIEGNRNYFLISHSDAREHYNIISNNRYLNEIDWKRINSLHKDLREILNLEFKFGNRVFETSEGWPSKDSVLVILYKPFLKKHKTGSAIYHKVNDPHYWKAEYRVSGVNHILACKF